MSKVKVSVDGGEKVIIKIPKGVNKIEFSDAIASAVVQTLQIIYPQPIHTFHPVLGKGGYNWDHKTQRAIVPETPTPSVEVELRNFSFHMRRLQNKILRNR